MQNKWLVLIAVSCGTFMATLDSSIVNVALPTITKNLESSLDFTRWVVILYYLVITCLLLPFGALSDLYGRKKMFLIGFLIFTIGSSICSLSFSLPQLLLSRLLQALGAAMLMANGPAIITSHFPANERGRALGFLAMVVAIGLVSGPVLGGILIPYLSWRSIFYINIPIGIFGMYLVQTSLTADKFKKFSTKKFDWFGSILLVVIFTSIISLFDPPNLEITKTIPFLTPGPILIFLTLLSFIIFFLYEKRIKYPLFEFSLLKNRTFWTANVSSFFLFMSYSSVVMLIPFYLEDILGFNTHDAALMMMTIPLFIFITSPISGPLSDKFGGRELSFIGALLSVFAYILISGLLGFGLNAETTQIQMVIFLALIGASLGIFQSPNNNAIMSSVPKEKLSSASALIATLRNLALVIGTGLATNIFQWGIVNSEENIIHAYKFTFLISGIISILATIAALGKKKGRYTE